MKFCQTQKYIFVKHVINTEFLDFLCEQTAGNTDFARFIKNDLQANLVIAHVINDFKQFAESGLDISEKIRIRKQYNASDFYSRMVSATST